MFEVIPPCTELHGIFICEADFSSSLDYQLFWVLIYFDDTLLDRSDGSEDVIVVTEEEVKEVEKPHTEVSPSMYNAPKAYFQLW